jgi:hypothetical protein
MGSNTNYDFAVEYSYHASHFSGDTLSCICKFGHITGVQSPTTRHASPAPSPRPPRPRQYATCRGASKSGHGIDESSTSGWCPEPHGDMETTTAVEETSATMSCVGDALRLAVVGTTKKMIYCNTLDLLPVSAGNSSRY